MLLNLIYDVIKRN